ncbi:hypothetical protein DY000_02044424 [Brassica cretica]|uniref:Uncharacterized protein n=1 Tax=Brassica cretica TaxID=69181 RepID=A0ABQ7EN71_BRACR|nr:hypothetical protein DY000_02044424 [Brassica cretica]
MDSEFGVLKTEIKNLSLLEHAQRLPHIPLPTLHNCPQRHPWMELIDRSSFASPDRFKFHSFIYVFAPSWPSSSANSNHDVDMFRLLYSSPLSTENRAPHGRLCLKLLLYAANLRAWIGSPDHLRGLALPMSSCSDSRRVVVLIFAVSASLRKRRRNDGDFLCFATQALQPFRILELAPIFSSV